MELTEDVIKDILFDLHKDDLKQRRRKLPLKQMLVQVENGFDEMDETVKRFGSSGNE